MEDFQVFLVILICFQVLSIVLAIIIIYYTIIYHFLLSLKLVDYVFMHEMLSIDLFDAH